MDSVFSYDAGCNSHRHILGLAQPVFYLSKFPVYTLPIVGLTGNIICVIVAWGCKKLGDKFTFTEATLPIRLTFFIIFLFFGISFIFFENRWLYAAAYAATFLPATLIATVLQPYLNTIFTHKQTERLFSFIQSGLVLGFMFSGFINSFIVELFGSKYLGMATCGFYGLTVILFYFLRRHEKAAVKAGHKHILKKNAEKEKIKKVNLKIVLKTKYLFLLAGYVALCAFLYNTIDYKFIDVLNHHFHSKDQIASFIGYFLGISAAINWIVLNIVNKPLNEKIWFSPGESDRCINTDTYSYYIIRCNLCFLFFLWSRATGDFSIYAEYCFNFSFRGGCCYKRWRAGSKNCFLYARIAGAFCIIKRKHKTFCSIIYYGIYQVFQHVGSLYFFNYNYS